MQTSCSVIQIPGEHHSHDTWPIALSRSSKQRINGRPVEILAWSARQPNACAFQLQVMVGRRHINVSLANAFPMNAVGDG